jgi:hypothetical protein
MASPFAQQPGEVWTQRLNFSDPHLYLTAQTQNWPRPDALGRPPHHDRDTIDHRFARQSAVTQGRVLPVADPADAQNAMNLIRATLRKAATT